MSATQQERKQQAAGQRARSRASGYIDGLYGIDSRRDMHPPSYVFAYDAGHSDGTAARDTLLASKEV